MIRAPLGFVDGNPVQKLNRRVVALAACACFGSVQVWAQPELKVLKDPVPAQVNQAYHITCEVTWPGDPKAWSILPAAVDAVDWATVNVTAARAEVRNGVNVIAQTIELTPTKDGTFQTPAITIAYLSPEDVKPAAQPDSQLHLADPDAHPRLRADPFPLPVQPHTTPAWLPVILGAFFIGASLVVALAFWRLRSRRKRMEPGMPKGNQADAPAAQAALASAKRRRIEGDYYGYYRELVRAMESLAPTDNSVVAMLTKRAEDAGYRGIRPSEDQLDADARALERAIAAISSPE